MILIINTCKEKLHYFEFVKPIEDVLRNNKIKFFTKHYSQIKEPDLEKADKVIICGTSLKDNDFMNNIEKFEWIRKFEKPIFGICAGMQVIGTLFFLEKRKLVFQKKNYSCLKKMTEIGFFKEKFDNFLGLNGEQEVYHLHNYYVDFSDILDFEVFAKNKISQAVKRKEKEIYGVLFHPEVRQKEMIINFAKL